MNLLFLLLLGLLTYLTYVIVQRSVAGITRTPVWILWLVSMTPIFIWSTWILLNGNSKQMPFELILILLGAFFICLPLYWFLVQWGRRDANPPAVKSPESQVQASATTTSVTPESQVKPPMNQDKPVIPRPINQAEETSLQTCFPWSIYYLQNIDYRPQAVICRGQLRSHPDVAYQTVCKNVESRFGDRFLVIFQEGLSGKPFFVLVPNPQAQAIAQKLNESRDRPAVALGLLFATILTTTLVAATGFEFTEDFFQSVLSNPTLLLAGLPYSLALIFILGVHELGHYLTARFYQLRVTLPYFLPIPLFVGTLGAFIHIRSPIPNRKILFDVGIAGPLAGLAVTVPILLWGLAHSTLVSAPPPAEMLDFNPFNPKSFLLLTLLSKLTLGSALTENMAIQLHPVAVAGCLGLVVTAFNLMPVGQLDGGHIVHAMFGQKVGAVIGQVTRLLMLLLSLKQQLLIPWAILLLFMPIIDEPALNDVSELNNQRDFLGLLALGILLMIILPTPAIVVRALF